MAFKGITAFVLGNNGEGGGGGGGTSNYNDLTNHPQINGNELIGNKTAAQLGLLPSDTDIPTKLSDLEADETHRTVTDSEKQSWNSKVDSVAGKGLSTNDYTDEDKTALANKVDKVTGKGLSTNDYTDGDKEDVAQIDGLVGSVGSLTSRVGIAEGKVRTLEGEMLSVQDSLDTKVDKVTGKGLSTNDYTNADKAIVDGVTTALAGKVDTSSVGTANGVAGLDNTGRVPSSQLPSYVDDVIEYASLSAFPATGEGSKIYIALDTNKTYRWSGSEYVEISESLALGETQGTAYEGNKGKANADAIDALETTVGAIPGQIETVVKDTVGWVGKNNLSIPTSVNTQSVNGIDFTFHRNSDGAVTKIDVIGTATSDARIAWNIPDNFVQDEKYKLTGWDVRSITQGKTVNFAILFRGAGAYILNATDTELEYTCNKTGYTLLENAIFVQNGTTIDASIYPMNRKVGTPATFEPYHESVEETIYNTARNQTQLIKDTVGNILNLTVEAIKAISGEPWNEYSKTINGITYTLIITQKGIVKEIIANGTASSSGSQIILNNVSVTEGRYLLGEAILNGSANTYYTRYVARDSNGAAINIDGTVFLDVYGENSIKDLPSNVATISAYIGVGANVTVNNLRFNPFVFRMDMERTKADNSVIAPVENGSTASQAYAVGDYFIKDDALGKTKAPIASGGTFTKDTNYEETNVAKEITELYKYIGILTTPVEAFTANSLPMLKRNITNAFYNGSLRAEIASGNFKNVRPGDYIIGQATGSTYYVAECDYWLGNGDSANGTTYPAYNTHHLGLMLFKPVGTTALWRGYGYSDKSWRVSASDLGRCPWNAAADVDPTDTEAIGSNSTNITRSYNGTNMSAYMGSFIRERIDAILLPQCFQADFGSENVLKRRNWLSNAVNTSAVSGARSDWQGIASGSVWVDRYIDLASEVELYGSRINSSSRDDVGVQCKQLPIYRNGRIHDFYPRMDLWTKGVASATDAANRSGNGVANATGASIAIWACPLGCVR